MSKHHFVRYGTLGQIGRFVSPDAVVYPRATSVVCRTPRGLEIGEVLSHSSPDGAAHDGTLLRHVTTEDQMLSARLEKNRDEAFAACQKLLAERRLPAVLVDVEALFDGESILFYYLGEMTPALEAVTSELAEAFDARAQLRRFAETLTEGCGPDCGTDAAAGGGCGTSGCSTCAVASSCQKS